MFHYLASHSEVALRHKQGGRRTRNVKSTVRALSYDVSHELEFVADKIGPWIHLQRLASVASGG